MIQAFADQGTEDALNGEDTKAALRACPQQLWGVALRKLDQLNRAVDLRD